MFPSELTASKSAPLWGKIRRNKKYKQNGYTRPPKCDKNEINNNKKKCVVALVVEFWFAPKGIVVKPDALNFVDTAVKIVEIACDPRCF